jgi:protein TonB
VPPKRAPSHVLAWALGVSIALHAAVLLAPPVALPRAVRTDPATRTPLTARLEPAPPPQAAAEVIKNTLAPRDPEPPRARPKPPAPSSAVAPRPKPRPQPERLAGETLERTLERLSETLLYPPEAVRRGLEGEVVVMLELDAGGRVVAASVASGSGHPILDDAAIAAARRLGALAPSLAGKAILLPVRFRLL